jgi:hypothetical protein
VACGGLDHRFGHWSHSNEGLSTAIPGLAILPGFLIILFSCDVCKLSILQEPVVGGISKPGIAANFGTTKSIKYSLL